MKINKVLICGIGVILVLVTVACFLTVKYDVSYTVKNPTELHNMLLSCKCKVVVHVSAFFHLTGETVLLSLWVYLFIYLFIYFVCLFVCLFIIYLFILLFIYSFIYLFIYLLFNDIFKEDSLISDPALLSIMAPI